MENNELYKSICNLTATFEELRDFIINFDQHKPNLDQSFNQYYSLEYILNALHKYKNKQITDKVLAKWANAYNWLITAEFETSNDDDNTNFSIKDIIVYEIFDWLDSLSFFDESVELFNVDNYIKVFSTLNEIYLYSNEWEVKYAPTNQFCEEDGESYVLFINNNKLKYIVFLYEGYGEYTIDNRNPSLEEDIDKCIEDLKAKGYQLMPFADTYYFDK